LREGYQARKVTVAAMCKSVQTPLKVEQNKQLQNSCYLTSIIDTTTTTTASSPFNFNANLHQLLSMPFPHCSINANQQVEDV
jgi:hypothetical protein